jgi:hypothetical protein
MTEQPVYRQLDKFDRAYGTLSHLPDVTHTKPATITTDEPLVGSAQTFIVQSFRQADRFTDQNGKEGSKSRDTLFLQYIDGDGQYRIVIPHKAVQAIIRQHDALTNKVRKTVAKQQAMARKARGELPGFMKRK